MGWHHIGCILDIPVPYCCSMGLVLGSCWTQIRHTSLPLPRHDIHTGIRIQSVAVDGYPGTNLRWLGKWECGRYPNNGCRTCPSERTSTSRVQHYAPGLDYRKYIWSCSGRLFGESREELSGFVWQERIFQKVPLRPTQYCCIDPFHHRGDNRLPVSSGKLLCQMPHTVTRQQMLTQL